MADNPGKKIDQYEVGELFTKAFNKTANISKAINGFKAAGKFILLTLTGLNAH